MVISSQTNQPLTRHKSSDEPEQAFKENQETLKSFLDKNLKDRFQNNKKTYNRLVD